MIQKLRRDLLTAAMVSLGLVFAVIVLAANLFNYGNMANEADALLTMLAENGGAFPHWESQVMKELLTQSPEVLFTCRYFSVSMADAETITAANTEKISAVDETGAAEYAKAVWSQEKGFYRNFRFIRWNGGEETLFVFMDCEKDLLSFYSFMRTSILIASLGLLSVFILLLLLSGRIVKPVAESYEKQKRFITDAGHEIKTPLTIISADADVLDMECGENEWLRDIQLQIKRLTALTNDLIYLSKMEEDQGHLQMTDFSLSDLTDELVQSFQALAKARGKVFTSTIQPGISFHGDERALSQVISNLLDNALKYSEHGGSISVELKKQGRSICLDVFNTTSAITEENLNNIFERFYRADPSRNSRTGGHGIGLSIVKAVVTAHKGEIRASSRDGRSLLISVSFPA